MTPQTSDMQSVLERLERLDRDNRRPKRGGLAALLLIASAVMMGQAVPKSRTLA